MSLWCGVAVWREQFVTPQKTAFVENGLIQYLLGSYKSEVEC
jgi:hypothetical protein